ncbi:FtsX-like permease family protein [Bernardetia sp. OM2101]|uniref:FtsX-like permease family protein n=1 Tax=Bernardetia sp. OM2101 TaxID=3344876 RepID=UPI0035CFC9C2
MNTALFIARRYFFAKKKRNFINLLTFMSMIGVAIGTAALIIVLSVFNGLENLTRKLHTAYNAELKISAKEGKSFVLNDSLLTTLKSVEGIQTITEVIEDNALIQYKGTRMAVHLKGVSDNFSEQYQLKEQIIDGKFKIKEGNLDFALLGYGVYTMLSVAMNDEVTPLQVWYPKKGVKNISPTNPLNAFNQQPIMTGGVLFIEQQFDQNHVIVPLSFAQKLTDYGENRTSLEIKVKEGFSINKVQRQLKRELEDKSGLLVKNAETETNGKFKGKFLVENAEQQQASILRAFKIERFFAYIAFSFVLALASFNIFFSLAMLAVEKRYDISLLFSIGASKSMIRRLFYFEGSIIAFIGAMVGIVLSVSMILAQQQWGFVPLGNGNSIVESYPVELEYLDVLWVCITVVVVTILASFVPARNASHTSITANLLK